MDMSELHKTQFGEKIKRNLNIEENVVIYCRSKIIKEKELIKVI